jgi:hypothetical protein
VPECFVVHMWNGNSSKNGCYSDTDDIAVYGVYLGMWSAEKSFEIYKNKELQKK